MGGRVDEQKGGKTPPLNPSHGGPQLWGLQPWP